MTAGGTPASGQRWDAIVIGSGIGGLTAAAYLAANGSKTLLLEQYSVLGGNSHVFRRREYEFEVGLHYVGDCGPGGNVPTILGGVGLGDRIEWRSMAPDGYDTLVFPDLTFKVPYGWDNYLTNLIEAFPDEKKALRAVVSIMRTIGETADRVTTPGSVRGMALFAARARTAAPWATLPLSALFKRYRLSPQARSVIGAEWAQHGCPPNRAPIALHAGLLHNYIAKGAYFPKGGSQELPARLAQVILANGGSIRTQATVDRIDIEGGAVTGVRLACGERFAAPVVVSNADMKRTYFEMVGAEHLRRATRRRTERWKMSAPFVNLYLGLDIDLCAVMPNTNYFSFPSSQDNGDQWYGELIDRAADKTLDEWSDLARSSMFAFVHSATVKDPDTAYAPPGHSSLEVMTLAPSDNRFWRTPDGAADGTYRRRDEYLEVKQRYTELLLERAYSVIPEAKGHVVWQETATPLTQQRYTLATGGSAYGIECNVRQYGPFRPNARTEIRGLYFAGSGTAWGPSVEGSMISGVQAASAVTGRNLFAEIRNGSVFGNPSAIPSDGPNWDPLTASKKGFAAPKHRAASARQKPTRAVNL